MDVVTHIAARVKQHRVGDVLVRRNPIAYRRARRRFDGLVRASLDERRAWTERRLKAVLAAAGDTAYGRRIGAPRSIEDWPVLEKEVVRNDLTSFVRGSLRVASTAATSGSTGVPLRLWRSLSSVADEQAAIDGLLARVGVPVPDYRAAVLRADDVKDPRDREPPYWIVSGGGRRLVLSSIHLTGDTVTRFAEAIEDFRPDVLQAYPSVLESFCGLLSEAGRLLRVPVTMCSSETMTASTWSDARRTLHTTVIDYYGLAERVAFAYAFDSGSYRFLPGYSLNELHPVPGDGDPHLYEIVATGLANLKMPLVRFRTGDLIRLYEGSDPNDVAYGVEPFAEVVGRTTDFLVAPDGARLIGMNHLPRGVANVIRMQLIQERADLVRVLVVPTKQFTEDDRSRIFANAAKKLPATMTISVEEASDLEVTSGGKVPFIIRRVGS